MSGQADTVRAGDGGLAVVAGEAAVAGSVVVDSAVVAEVSAEGAQVAAGRINIL